MVAGEIVFCYAALVGDGRPPCADRPVGSSGLASGAVGPPRLVLSCVPLFAIWEPRFVNSIKREFTNPQTVAGVRCGIVDGRTGYCGGELSIWSLGYGCYCYSDVREDGDGPIEPGEEESQMRECENNFGFHRYISRKFYYPADTAKYHPMNDPAYALPIMSTVPRTFALATQSLPSTASACELARKAARVVHSGFPALWTLWWSPWG
ncbi:hypothetical protein Q5A_005570 [Serratia inhibens PRI-2C]|nr:hypothetical protein Q5A_005570 [Serratia inhibens PRI-2C]